MADVLLDTHALLWWATGDPALGKKVKRLILDGEARIIVSAATAWEIATKVRLGKLTWQSSLSVESYCALQGFERLAVTFTHAERAGSWKAMHGDPFDRMLAAQSQLEELVLATNDEKLRAFGVRTIW